MDTIPWSGVTSVTPWTYTCGYCGKVVGSNAGFQSQATACRIYLCPFCGRPTFTTGDKQWPGVAFGNEVGALPAEIGELYGEARRCMATSSHTSAVLTCRKILMNVAVAQGAAAGQNFLAYVEHLAKNGYVPPNGRGWVDHIRKKGNEANHEIKLMSRPDAEELISFVEMLLKFVYEFPAKVPPSTP